MKFDPPPRQESGGDLPLSTAGRQQALNAGWRLGGEVLAAVYASDLSRTAETARIIVGANRAGFDAGRIEVLRVHDAQI